MMKIRRGVFKTEEVKVELRQVHFTHKVESKLKTSWIQTKNDILLCWFTKIGSAETS